MKISASITNFSWPDWPRSIEPGLRDIVRAAEDAGLDTLWVADHLFQADPASDPSEPMLEAYTTLGFLAASTERIKLGTLVTGIAFRPLALLVKAVTTLDVLSHGRAWLGIGAGYGPGETDAMGLDLPPTPVRFDLVADTVELAERMWAGDTTAYDGRAVMATGPVGSPGPYAGSRLPILIGGTGERRTLRLVAEKADACNLFDIPDGGVKVRRQLDVLEGHCADVGRSFDEIERTLTTALEPDEPADRMIERCHAIADLGIQHIIFITRGRPWTPAAIGTLGVAVSALGER